MIKIMVMVMGVKILLVGLWGVAILILFSISPIPKDYQNYVLILTGIVLMVHFIEFVAIKGKLKRNNDIEMNFLQTMLWGFGYWLPILKK